MLVGTGAGSRVRLPAAPELQQCNGVRRACNIYHPRMAKRLAFAAAHIALRDEYREVGHSPDHPGDPRTIGNYIDLDATLGIRQRLAGLGFGIAEAMDTAQRFEIGWENAQRLIVECGALAPKHGFIAGAGTDHLDHIGDKKDLVDGVVHQAGFIQRAGGTPILLPLPWLAAERCDAGDYVDVYGAIIAKLDGPLYVHWLGDMFAPALAGYFPGDSFSEVMALDRCKVRGVKLSLLDAEFETRTREALAQHDQIVLTGDDLHFARLILDGSHAVLGVLDAIAAPAAHALQLLDDGDDQGYLAAMQPCEALGQHLFAPPTRHYKAGLAFLAWLNGLQGNFLLVNHEQRTRDVAHYIKAAELAHAAGAIADRAIAADRLAKLESDGVP